MLDKSHRGLLRRFPGPYYGSAPALLFTAVVALVLLSCPNPARSDDWPREIELPEVTITMYQPQLESFEGDSLTARAAVSVKARDADDPVFGAVWIAGRVATDRDTREVTLLDLVVTNVRFPDATESQMKRLAEILETEIPKWNLVMSLDVLLATLEVIERTKAGEEGYKMDPPEIIYVTHPAVLVFIDGKPVMQAIEGTDLKRVANTPMLILYEPTTKKYYLSGGEDFFAADDPLGQWQKTDTPPKSVVAVIEEALKEAEADEDGEGWPESDVVPEIIVRTGPAELIESDGEASFAPVENTDLLYMDNSSGEVFMDIQSQKYFTLLSGRWYTSSSMTGQWSYVPAEGLPASFRDIPPDSEKGYIRAHVAGTQEAEDAMMDAQIPQTAAVDRKEASVEVKYDGEPRFENVEDTEMQYAVNTDKSVVRVEDNYYCCDNAVWFVSGAPVGPWTVCTSVPRVIYTIPPSCPVYNVRYVYVYSYTPTVVYVGYTPGYVGCYAYGGTVIYGTGWHYHPWYGTYYYPRPATFGFSMRYNYYTGGWAFGVSWGSPYFRIGIAWGRPGFWGPGYYRPGYWGPGYRPPGAWRPRPTPYGRGPTNIYVDNSRNIYRSRKDVRPADRGLAGGGAGARPGGPGTPSRLDRPTPRPAGGKDNNVFVDRDGNVYRRTKDGWQERDKSGWTSRDKSQRTPSAQQRSNRSRSDLDRQQSARRNGAQRAQNYRGQSTRPSQPVQRGRSGGGSRRR